MLLRASPDWVIRQNTFFVTNGPAVGGGSNRGGLRFRSGGSYGGTTEDMTILDNIIVTTVDSRAYDYTTIGSFPANHVNDYNLLWRPNGGTDPAAVAPNGTMYALNSTGLANGAPRRALACTTSGRSIRCSSRRRRRLPPADGSPAIDAASWGGDLGAAVYLP